MDAARLENSLPQNAKPKKEGESTPEDAATQTGAQYPLPASFITIDGIPGPAEDERHKGAIPIGSWSFGADQSGAGGYVGGGAGVGRVNMHDLHFTMRTNKATPALFLACSTGKHIVKAVLTHDEPKHGSVSWTFGDVIVSSFLTGAAEHNQPLIDAISLNFASARVEYTERAADGTASGRTEAGFDIKKMRPV